MKKQFLVIGCTVILSAFPRLSMGQTQLEMTQAAGSRLKDADHALNIIYRQILTQYASDTVFISNLKGAQRLWIKFRDAELAMMYPDRDWPGSAEPMCKANYLEKLTRERIEKLKAWVEGVEEGDICSGSIKFK